MKQHISARSGLTMAAFVALMALLVAGPASAGQTRGGGRSPSGGAGRAVPKGGSGGGGATSGGSAAPATKGGATKGGSDGGQTAGTTGTNGSGSGGTASPSPRTSTPTSSHSPNDGTAIAAAAPRTLGSSGGGTIVIPNGYYGGFYPWGYGGYGFGGYYSGYYDPWFSGGYGYGYPRSSYSRSDDAALRIKVKPRNGTVYVDGYYAGVVDDFDGIFQRLHVEPGAHRVEVRADGYQPLEFEVRVEPGRTVTYRGDLQKEP